MSTVVPQDCPLNVTGVGTGGRSCQDDCRSPIVPTTTDGTAVAANYTAPTVEDSELSQLLGLHSLRQIRAILDLAKMELHFCGEQGGHVRAGSGAGRPARTRPEDAVRCIVIAL